MLSRFLKNRTLAGLYIGLIITIISTIGILTGLFTGLHSYFTNSLYTLNDPSKDIIIIAVDDKSTEPAPEGLGRFNQWSRTNFTRLLNVLEKEYPKVIAIDFIFHSPTTMVSREQLLQLEDDLSKLSTNKEKLEAYNKFLTAYKSSLENPIDNEFARELENFNNIILDSSLSPDEKTLIKPLAKFSTKATLGVARTYLDRQGILRTSTPSFNIPSENKNYDDVALATAKKYLGKDEIDIPLQENQMLVNFFGDTNSYRMIPFIDVLNGDFEKNFFRNKIILVGATSSKEVHDEYFTPRSNITPMSGIEFIANEIQTILDNKFLLHQSKSAQVLTIAGISIGLTIALNYLGILLSLIATVLAAILYLLVAHFFYRRGLILNMFYPFAAIVLAYLASWIYKYFIADRKKRELKSAFGHYVSDELVEQISKNPDMVKLGGEKKIVTVFFSDIKDSTAHSEKTPIELWVSQINEYFTVMENVLKKSGGTLDKYEGDAIMGFWNAPVSQPDHVLRAYATAIGMQKALQQLHAKWQGEGKPLIEFRIGINTGEALVGNFGSASRFDYTVMGDTVNTASRLENSANKTYGTTVIVAGFENATAPAARAAQNFLLRELDTVYLPGKKEPVKLFELIGLASEATDEVRNLIKLYTEGLVAYRCKDFPSAIKSFMAIQTTLPTFKNDNPTQILLTRCQKLQSGEKINELDERMVFGITSK